MILVSIVVPTFKRPELLNRCLAALTQQNFDRTTYEIIIADDAATEETKRLVEYWLERIGYVPGETKNTPLLRYIPVTEKHGPAAARNVGWRAASGEIIAFTDDDCIPNSNWLKAGINAFKDEIIGVRGRIIVPLPNPPTDYELNTAGLEKAEFVTANCFYRREAIASINGFDERFTMPWREDSDLFFSLLKQGGEFVYAPDAIVTHPIRPAPWGISLSQQNKSMFNALLYKKHPNLYKEKLPPVTPWHYYLIVTSVILFLLATLTKHPYFAVVALMIWLIMTGRFCIARLQNTSHTPKHIAEMIFTSLLIPFLSIFWRIFGAFKFRVFFL